MVPSPEKMSTVIRFDGGKCYSGMGAKAGSKKAPKGQLDYC
jgi:hypothetical protein